MPNLVQCFSALVASGNGQRCNSIKEKMQSAFSDTDQTTKLHKSLLYKFGKEDHPEQHKKLRMEVASILNPMFEGVDAFYFGDDMEHNNA